MNQQEIKKYKSSQKIISQKRTKNRKYPKELCIIAEGDSWFDYPFRKDIIDYLIEFGYAVDKVSKLGDTLENMVYGTDYKKTKNQVENFGPVSMQETLRKIRKSKPHFFLFSAGGNDIVGPEILVYLNHRDSPTSSLINKKLFLAQLQRMQETIEYYIRRIHATCKSTNILMDGYDYAKINGKGYEIFFGTIKIVGPWILPSMGKKGIINKKDQESIIKYLVDEYNKMLKRLAKRYTYFHHLDLRGEFPKDSQWHNEIHLNNSGFKQVARLYHNRIEQVLGYNPLIKHKEVIYA